MSQSPTTEHNNCTSISIPEVAPEKAAALGVFWALFFVVAAAMIVPPVVVVFTIDILCVPQDLPSIRAWHIVHSAIWLVLIVSGIKPLLILIKDGENDKKKGCCVGISLFRSF